jgi:PAS domain S-box-containing protein
MADNIHSLHLLERLRRPALWFVLLLLAATVVFSLLDLKGNIESPYLVLALYVLFIGVPCFFVALLAARGFMRTGVWAVLWLGGATLSYGVANLMSPLLLLLTTVNTTIAAHNMISFLAGLLNLVGAFFIVNRVPAESGRASRNSIVAQVYGAISIFIVVVTVLCIAGVAPQFFVQGTGGTPIRQAVLISATLLFLVSGIVLFREYIRLKAEMVYWYSLGLLLAVLSMSGLILQSSMGSPLNWTARMALIFSGIYLLAGTLATLREARTRHLPAGDAFAAFFRRPEENLRLLFDSVKTAVIVYDLNGMITAWNKGAADIYGWKAEEALSQRLDSLLQTRIADASGHSGTGVRDIEQVGGDRELLQKGKDGRDIYILSSLTALMDDDGNHVGYVAMNQDITERKKTEEEAKSLARFPAENPNPVLRSTRAGRILYANTASNALLQFWKVGVGGDIPPNVWDHLCGAADTNVRKEFEIEINRRWLWLLCVPIPGEDYVNIYATDITDRKKSEQLKDEFIGLVSHELKTPLTVIMGAIDTAMTPGVTKDQERELLYDAFTSADELADIVDNLLELSRAQADRLNMNKTAIDIGKVAAEVVRKLLGRTDKHRLIVEMKDLPVLTADPLRVTRILHNLVENAIKYSPSGGDITVFARSDSHDITVGISDHGIGMSAEQQSRLFQPFERLDNSPRSKGVGLGLMVAQRLVDAHGGRIWVESQQDKGSTFFFTLPLA